LDFFARRTSRINPREIGVEWTAGKDTDLSTIRDMKAERVRNPKGPIDRAPICSEIPTLDPDDSPVGVEPTKDAQIVTKTTLSEAVPPEVVKLWACRENSNRVSDPVRIALVPGIVRRSS